MKSNNCITFLMCLMAARIPYAQSIYQRSRINPGDSISLGMPVEPSVSTYSEITIFRKGIPIFHFQSDSLEVRGYQGSLVTENYNPSGYMEYIFKCDERPEPDRYLVVRIRKDTATLLGVSPHSSGEIFGDVDLDGYFEIGGVSSWTEEGDTPEFRVFKVDEKFPVDRRLTESIQSIIRSKVKRGKRKRP